MEIRRLGWAGLEVTAQGHSLVVDYVEDGSPFLNAYWAGGTPNTPNASSPLAALVTHLHEDHTDLAAIESVVGPTGTVLRPAPFVGTPEEGLLTAENESRFAASGFDVRHTAEWESHKLGPFTVTAVPAIDGLGDPQVSWVIEADGVRVLHGGDTMFHGYWWLIASRLGPIDVAALPVNGAVVNFPNLQPASALPAAMSPAQAVQAAVSLRAEVLVPIHFGIVWPEAYQEDSDPIPHVRAIAEASGQRVVVLDGGESFAIPAR